MILISRDVYIPYLPTRREQQDLTDAYFVAARDALRRGNHQETADLLDRAKLSQNAVMLLHGDE